MHATRNTAAQPDNLFFRLRSVYRPLTTVLLLGILVLPAVPDAQAENLRVTADRWPPYISPELPGRGLAMALVTEALKRYDYGTELRIEELGRALEGTRLGVYDLVVGVWQTETRAKGLHFSDPFLVNDLRFITLSDNLIEYNQLEDLQSLMIGTLRDYAYNADFLNNNKLTRIPRSDVVQNLNALLEGEIDLAVTDRFTALHAIHNYLPDSRDRFRFLRKPLETRNLHIAVSRKRADHEQIVQQFNRAIKTMRADGTYDAILKNYIY